MSTFLKRLSSTIGGLFGSSSSDLSKYSADIENGYWMEHLKPFVVTLPHGDMLWHYVLIGDNKVELDNVDGFINLDEVLLVPHAMKNAPEFYKSLRSSCRLDGYPSQYDMFENLRQAVFEITETLIERKSKSKNRLDAYRQAYLRILDIFFFINDQNTFHDEIYEQLVVDSKTAFMNDSEYYQRYSLESYGDNGQLPARLEERINKFIAEFNDYSCCVDNELLNEMSRVFSETRLTYDAKFFVDNNAGSYVLACYLLWFDKHNKVNDEYTKYLRVFVEKNEEKTIDKVLRSHLNDDDTDCIDAIMNWLCQKSESLSLQELVNKLSKEFSKKDDCVLHTSPYGGKQIAYELFNNISQFNIFIVASYWLEQAGESSQLSLRLLNLCVKLAPHRTIQKISKQYRHRNGRGDFYDHKVFKTFLKTLKKLKVPEPHIQGFEIVYLQQCNHSKYLWRIGKYGIEVIREKTKDVDQGLKFVAAKHRQQFYLDYWRLEPKKNLLKGEFNTVLREYIGRNYALADHCLANAFILHGVKVSILWGDFFDNVDLDKKPVVKDDNMVKMELGHENVIVLIDQGKQFSLLADSTNNYKSLPDDNWSPDDHVVIIKSELDKEIIIDITENLPKLEERRNHLLEEAVAYVKGKLSYKEFRKNSGCYLDVDEFTWTGNYANKRNHLLPFVLCESDIRKRNRLINLFWPRGDVDSNEAFDDLTTELYFESLLAQGDICLEERWDLYLDEMSDDIQDKYCEFKQALIDDIVTMRKGA